MKCPMLAFLIAASLGEPSVLLAQRISHRNDHVLNYGGRLRLTLATGIPYVGIGEVAYGLSDRLTVGVLAGVTPRVDGYGVRARAVLYQPSERFRIYFCTPIMFYPRTKGLGGDPWWLTRPNINFERVTGRGLRYKAGASLMAAASHYSIFGQSSRAKLPPGVWNAVHGGFSAPLSDRATFQVEASLVMSGLKVAGKDWVGGPPVILVIGTSWSL